jgi:hypothetical protein
MADNEVMSKFKVASPMRRQVFIAALIHHLTILARGSYDTADAATKLQLVNEHVHRLIGHLWSIIPANEEIEDWRVSSIGEVISKLHPESQQKLGRYLENHEPT